ncbi:MAG: hypothetical protein ISS31_01080 [Kiritimatiellae bacterium]|nr:hypothetical protein [Kiritimatiellia bacterium]
MWSEFERLTPIAPSAYKEALDEYVARVSPLPGVVGIATFGSVRDPGISDLDVLVVVRDDDPSPPADVSNAVLSREPAGNVWAHDVSVLPASLWSSLSSLAFCSHMNPVAGNLDVPSQDVAREASLLLLFDGLMDRLLVVARMLCRPRCHTRNVLLVLNSFGHTLSLCEKLRVPFEPVHAELCREIREIRANWFTSERTDGLFDLSREFLKAFTRLVGPISDALATQESAIASPLPAPTIRIGENVYIGFDDRRGGDYEIVTKEVALPFRTARLHRVNFWFPRRTYETYFAACVAAMLKSGSSRLISWHLPRHGSESRGVDPGVVDRLVKRHEAIVSHVRFLREHAYTFGAVHAAGFLPVGLKKVAATTRARRAVRTWLAGMLS